MRQVRAVRVLVLFSLALFALYLPHICADLQLSLVVSSESHPEWLAWDKVERFQTLPLPHSAYKGWARLALVDKLPFLVDQAFLANAKRDYAQMCLSAARMGQSDEPINQIAENRSTQNATIVVDCEKTLSEDFFLSLWQDFSSAAEITEFFRDCDSVRDGFLDWEEFVLCRGRYDRQGRPFDVSEFDYLENIVISDYRSQLDDPNNPLVLELIERGEEL